MILLFFVQEFAALNCQRAGSFLNALRGFKPRISNISMSSLIEGLGVVNNLSPANIELAPAIKHNACSGKLISKRPADKRNTVRGIIIRVVAIILTISHIETLCAFSSGVPFTATSALIGTDSGCCGRLHNV